MTAELAGRHPRLPRVERDTATPRQVEVLDELLIARGKPGGRLANLYAMILHQPEVARRMGAVGAYCRFHSSLEELVREAAILAVCVTIRFDYEVSAHVEIARARGMPADQLGAILVGSCDGLPPALTTAVRFARSAVSGPIARALADEVRGTFGTAGLIDLTAIAAHYSALAIYDRVLQPDPDPPGNSLAKPEPSRTGELAC
jgi:4-carboxymuconolactone decarboxylase